MIVILQSSDALTVQASAIQKTKYFPVELHCIDMLPETAYDMYVDGVLQNAFCRPFGGDLGDPLLAGKDGKLTVQWLMAIPYQTQYTTVKPDVSGFLSKSQIIEFRDPNGLSSFTHLPIRLKASSA